MKAEALRCAVAAACIMAAVQTAAAQSGDIRSGRQLAIGCQGCHGLDGLSKQPDAPNLAAQPEIYLVRSMREYKTRQRRHEQMNVVAEALSEAEIANVSAYYAAIEIEVVKKPE
ncbi:MAG: c-type cytochrome [Beijerinckiaceae bacterium]